MTNTTGNPFAANLSPLEGIMTELSKEEKVDVMDDRRGHFPYGGPHPATHTHSSDQCPERCGGVVGHTGWHQTTDYLDIRTEAWNAALSAAEEAVGELEPPKGATYGTFTWARRAVLSRLAALRKET